MPEPCECPARKALELARRALEANRHQYLAYGDGFTFCCGCGEREPHGEQAANPCGIPHSPNCPHTLQCAATDSINAALSAPCPCEGLRAECDQLRADLAEALDYKRAAEAYILRLRQIVYAGRPEVVSQAKDEIRQWDLAGSVERAATVLAKHGKVKA